MKLVAPQSQPAIQSDSTKVAFERQAEPVKDPVNSQNTELVDARNTTNAIAAQPSYSEHIINIETELYSAQLSNKNGGSFVSFILKKYRATDTTSVQLVDNFNKNHLLFKAISIDGTSLILDKTWEPNTKVSSIEVIDASKSISFTTNVLGRTITKTLTFNPGSYQINVHLDLIKIGDQLSQGTYDFVWNGGLPSTEKNKKDELSYYKAYVYQGDELSSEKLGKDKSFSENYRGLTNWVAVRNKYFITALIPDDKAVGASLSGTYKTNLPHFDIAVKQQANSSNSFTLYLGPLKLDEVSALNVGLEKSMSLGWSLIRPISRGVLAALVFLHKFIPNYGVVLIVFSILVKVLVYPLTKKSYQSMRAMGSLQPKIQALKTKYAKDPQKLNKATMTLYKEEGVNPMGGCLPILIQMPLLFALFQVFRSTIELRGEPFILWINDLSAPDTLLEIGGFPLNILPLLMAVSMFIQQKMMPTTAGPGQNKSMMYFMNIFMIFIFYRLPSGLNLYYTLFNVLTILQQKYITPHDQPIAQTVGQKKK